MDSKNSSQYRILAQRVCKILKIDVQLTSTLSELLKTLENARTTPYMTSTQKDIRDILGEIVADIEKRVDVKDIEQLIEQLDSEVNYDTYWD